MGVDGPDVGRLAATMKVGQTTHARLEADASQRHQGGHGVDDVIQANGNGRVVAQIADGDARRGCLQRGRGFIDQACAHESLDDL